MDYNIIVIFSLLTFCFVLAAVDDTTDRDEPSSSTTFKKIKKKIDKREALFQFKIDNQTNKEKKMPFLWVNNSCTVHKQSVSQ
jgi:hypothetical protein